jgi:DNA-binding response OmpR family regulator
VILITAFGGIETALDAMKLGAFHYVVKPFRLVEIAALVHKALKHCLLHQLQTLLAVGELYSFSPVPQIKSAFFEDQERRRLGKRLVLAEVFALDSTLQVRGIWSGTKLEFVPGARAQFTF